MSYYDGALREYLSEKLPEYMVPQNYHFMAQLPTLSNGKINRKNYGKILKKKLRLSDFQSSNGDRRKTFGYLETNVWL